MKKEIPSSQSNPLRPWAFGGKGAEGMKKEITSSPYITVPKAK